VPFVQAEQVHGGQLNEKGDQCIVAIIDTGVDILHEAFLDVSGQTTRIDAVWVQRDPTGPTPNQVDPATFQQTRGTLYQFNDIQTFINNDLIIGNNTTPSVLRDPNGHGTHVASIAAGRAVGSFYGGVAPEARIVVVIPDLKTTPGNPVSLGYSSSHQAALEFLLAYKRKYGLPMAINLSQGMNAGAHDGMTMLEKVFDSITTKGSEKGMVIVKSAGNEFGHDGHAQVQPAQATCVTITWNSSNDLRTDDYFEFWYHRDDELSFSVVDPNGTKSPVVDHTNRHCQWPLNGNTVLMRLIVNHPDNTDNLLVVQVFPDTLPILTGTWTLEIAGVAVAGDKWLHGWVERSDHRPVKFTSCVTNDMTLSIPGTADTVISVAASNVPPPLPVSLQRRSSRGPTRNNGPKPDLYAPGDGIVAAHSNQFDHQAVRTNSGTSMAAPHVTGAMALVMSARHKKAQIDISKPQFNALQLGRMVRQSANGYTGQHNSGVGYGGLNVLSLFSKADLA
jgi:endonuclease G